MNGKGHPLPDRTRARIRVLHSQGVQVQDIAIREGISRRSVYRAIQVPAQGTDCSKSGQSDLTEAQTPE